MFPIRAKNDIVIQGFDIITKRNAVTTAAKDTLIYTRSGGFNETSLFNKGDGFTLLYEDRIPDQESELLKLGGFKQNVRISGGETQMFYVFSRRGLLYANGGELGAAYS